MRQPFPITSEVIICCHPYRIHIYRIRIYLRKSYRIHIYRIRIYLQKSLPDKVCECPGMCLRRIDLSLGRIDNLYCLGDVAGKLGHDFEALDILLYLTGIRAVHSSPVI